MKIKTRLKIIAITATTALAGIVSVNGWLKTETANLNRQKDLVRNLNFNYFQSNQIRDEYFIHKTERPKQQWFAIDKKITEQFRAMSVVFTDTSRKKELAEIILLHQGIANLYNLLITHDQLDSAYSDAQKVRDMIIYQMMGESHRMYQQCVLLSSDIDNMSEKQSLYSGIFNILSISFLGLIIVIFSKMMSKSVIEPLRSIKDGTKIIAAGNFAYRLNVVSSDEIGELAHDFDLMTEHLATISVSRNELHKEIERRTSIEETLRKSEEKFRNLFNNAEVGMFKSRLDGTELLDVNQKFLDITGRTLEDTLGKPSAILWADPKEREEIVRRIVADGRVSDFEYKMLNKQGTVRNCLVSLVLYRDQGIIEGSILDITERKIIERKLQEKNTELESFAYTVSHDLKSPLITIQSYAGMIVSNIEEGKYERAKDDMKRIEGAAAKMTALLDDLLELSRSGRMMNKPSMVDMNRLVKEVLMMLAGSITESQIEVALQPDLPAVIGDRKRITEVVQNLVENAIKYMGDQAVPRIEIGARQDSKEPVFFVNDNGKGIDQRFHETIFGLFNKLDAKSDGTGVGLALVKRIIEIHGGRVWVESEGAGQGSRFCFTVPEENYNKGTFPC